MKKNWTENMDAFLKFRKTRKEPVILGGVVLLCSVLGYFLWVPLKASRDVARLHACAENIKQLRKGILEYLMEHENYPAKLSELYPKYIGSLDVFICPAKKRNIHGAEEINARSGYVLLLSPETPLKDTDQPILCDRRANHLDKFDKLWTGNVLFSDGHITSIIDKKAVSDWKYRFDFHE